MFQKEAQKKKIRGGPEKAGGFAHDHPAWLTLEPKLRDGFRIHCSDTESTGLEVT